MGFYSNIRQQGFALSPYGGGFYGNPNQLNAQTQASPYMNAPNVHFTEPLQAPATNVSRAQPYQPPIPAPMQTKSVGMAGGARPQDYQASADAMSRAAQLKATQTPAPVHHMGDAANPIQDWQLRSMYGNIQNRQGMTQEQKDAEFHATAAKYGINGQAWLQAMRGPGGDSSTSVMTPTVHAVPGNPGIPASLLGPQHGGTPPPGLIGIDRDVDKVAKAGAFPAQTYTTYAPGPTQNTASVDSRFLLPQAPTSPTQVPAYAATPAPITGPASAVGVGNALGNARALPAVSPYTQADAQRVQQADVNRMQTAANAYANAAPISPREAFDANVGVATAQAQAPILARTLPAQINADARTAQNQDDNKTKQAISENQATAKTDIVDKQEKGKNERAAGANKTKTDIAEKQIAAQMDRAIAGIRGANGRALSKDQYGLLRDIAHETVKVPNIGPDGKQQTMDDGRGNLIPMFHNEPKFKDAKAIQEEFQRRSQIVPPQSDAQGAPPAQAAPTTGAPKTIASEEEHNQLKDGETFIWNGKQLTKGQK